MQNAFVQRRSYVHGKTNISLKLLAYLSIITASFDTVFTVELGGFTIRFTQLVMMILAVLLMCNFVKRGKFIVPFHFGLLAGYVGLNTIFLFNAIDIRTSVLYAFWLMLDALVILIIVNMFITRDDIIGLFRVLFTAIFCAALIGVIQFFLLSIGVSLSIRNTYALSDGYTRIRGFSFEPSYYGTYLIFGWCALAYLIEKKNTLIFSLKVEKVFFLILSFTFLITFSRMSILTMFAYLLFRLLANMKGNGAKNGNGIAVKRRNIKFVVIILCILLGIFLYIVYLYRNDFSRLRNMVGGLGILDQANHSSASRWSGMMETIRLFLKSPLLGCSLGDLDYRLLLTNTRYQGIRGRVSGMSTNMFAEAFAATGLVGGFLFLLYNIRLMFGCMKKRLIYGVNNSYVIVLKSLCIGYVFQVITMLMHANSLRVYLWINMAVISVAYRGLKFFGERP